MLGESRSGSAVGYYWGPNEHILNTRAHAFSSSKASRVWCVGAVLTADRPRASAQCWVGGCSSCACPRVCWREKVGNTAPPRTPGSCVTCCASGASVGAALAGTPVRGGPGSSGAFGALPAGRGGATLCDPGQRACRGLISSARAPAPGATWDGMRASTGSTSRHRGDRGGRLLRGWVTSANMQERVQKVAPRREGGGVVGQAAEGEPRWQSRRGPCGARRLLAAAPTSPAESAKWRVRPRATERLVATQV